MDIGDTRKAFQADEIKIVNEEDGTLQANIDSNGTASDELNNETIDSIIKIDDEWTRNNYKFDNPTESVSYVTTESLVNLDHWNNKNQDSVNFGTPQYVYDEENGVITFTDESLIKVDPFGCQLDGTGDVTLNELVRDLELMTEFERIASYGSVYDFQVRQLSFGSYKYANSLICTNLAKGLGYLSLDKIINDEYARLKRQNELNQKFAGTPQEEKYPPYSGILSDPDYLETGWINIDHLIHASFENEWAYDSDWSLAIRTRKFKDRKRVLIYLFLSYASGLWELQSPNKLTDFGLRVIDRTTKVPVDFSVINNSTCSIHGNPGFCQFVGQLASPQFENDDEYEERLATDDEENPVAILPGQPVRDDPFKALRSGQPTNEEICKTMENCDKVFTDRCSNRHFKFGCRQDLQSDDTSSNDPNIEDESVPHELMPQFRINPITNWRNDKKDILNTIDAIHWTTGIEELEQYGEDQNWNLDWLEEIKEEFGPDTFNVTYLNQNRGFHYAGGDVTNGLASSGFYSTFDDANSFYQWGNRPTTERWNGTSWSIVDTGGCPQRGLGLGGGDYEFFAQGFGVKALFGLSESNNLPAFSDLSPTSFDFDSSFYYWTDEGGWVASGPSSIVSKHSVAGTLVAKEVIPGNAVNSSFSQITFNEEELAGCNDDMKAFADFLEVAFEGEVENVEVARSASGFAFGGSTGDVTLDEVSCYDFDDTVVFFSIALGDKTTNGTPETFSEVCSYVEPTMKYPIKTIGTKYVGDAFSGVATGGKTCTPINSCGPSAKSNLYYRYFDPDKYSEDNSSIVRHVYEFTGNAWIRRDDMPEGVAYHTGVGNTDWAIFWGGIHSSLEQPNLYVNIPGCGDWFDLIKTFGGAFHRHGICGLDRETRYADFATFVTDENDYFRFYAVNDRKDLNNNGIRISEDAPYDPSVEELSGSDWTGYVTHFGHFKQHAIPVDDDELEITYFFDGETAQSNPIKLSSGINNDQAFCISGQTQPITGIGSYVGDLSSGNWNGEIFTWECSGSSGLRSVERYSKAPRDNFINNLIDGYDLHPTTGGMWLWTRPSKGENLFHPENFSINPTVESISLSGCEITPETCHSFASVDLDNFAFCQGVSGCLCDDDLVYSFYLGRNGEGIVQGFYGLRKDSIYERWNNPFYTTMTGISGVSIDWNGVDTDISQITLKGTFSVGQFVSPDYVVDFTGDSPLARILDECIRKQFYVADISSGFYDFDHFQQWQQDPDDLRNYPIKSYDPFKQWFNETGVLATIADISGSSVRDRAVMFPWGDLLDGNVDNHGVAGRFTWTWGEDGDIYLAETLSAETVNISGETYITDALGRTIATSAGYYPDEFWREVHRIRRFDIFGNEIFDYRITYDEAEGEPLTAFTIDPSGFTLFGTGHRERIVDKTRWNHKKINSSLDDYVDFHPDDINTQSHEWLRERRTIPTEAYNYKREDLCTVLNQNDEYGPGDSGVFSVATSANATWIWSVPYKLNTDLVVDDVSYIQSSPLVIDISGNQSGAEIIRRVTFVDGSVQLSRAVLAELEGIGLKDYGLSTGIGISGQPFDFVEDQLITNTIPDYDTLHTVFPWNVIGDEGLIGPEGSADMIDALGNYWFAVGDKINVNRFADSDLADTDFINVYTIVRVPSSKKDKFRKLALGKENLEAAESTLDEFELYVSSEGIETGDPSTILLNDANGFTIRGARNREGFLEAINSLEGKELYDVYVRLWDYNLSDPSINNYVNSQMTVELSGGYALPLDIEDDMSLTAVQQYDLITSGDLNCQGCRFCVDADSISGFNPTVWTQHNHEEWVAPYLESRKAGVFSEDGFNVWLSAGNQPRWGAPIWSTIDNGKAWVHYRQSRLGANEENDHLILSQLTASFSVDDFTGDEFTPIPVKIDYDEYFYRLSDYEIIEYIQEIVSRERWQDNICGETINAFVANNPFVSCVTGAALDVDPDLGYTEWATSFILEYKKREELPDGTIEKYYFKYDHDNKGSNTLIPCEGLNTESPTQDDWRRFQDGVGLGGDAPIFNTDGQSETYDCHSLQRHYVGQQAFGTPDRAIICGGYSIGEGGQLSSSRAWWEYSTNGPTFKWNRFVINPEDTINKNYRNRNLSPFYTNGDHTLSESMHGAIIFDAAKPLVVERFGTAIFEGQNSVVVEFEQFPDFAIEKDKYSISLQVIDDNVKVWWSDKSEGSFTINSELTWSGSVDWKIIYVDEIPVDKVDNLDEQETFDQFEDL
jgi:hypothetical protein